VIDPNRRPISTVTSTGDGSLSGRFGTGSVSELLVEEPAFNRVLGAVEGFAVPSHRVVETAPESQLIGVLVAVLVGVAVVGPSGCDGGPFGGHQGVD